MTNLATLDAREGVTVFLTTPDMTEAEKLCTQVAVIRRGKLLVAGHPDELRTLAGGPQIESVGRGFSEGMLNLMRARSEVAAVEQQDTHLSIHLREEIDTASLVSLLVGAGAQVEEVREG